jgi:N-acetylmuramic acid 6-phosphate etherase
MKSNGQFYTLGIEGGGTKTTWALVADDGTVHRSGQTTAGNLQLQTPAETATLFDSLNAQLGDDAAKVKAVGGAFAGCHLPVEKKRAEDNMRRLWPQANPVFAGEDTRSAFAAAHGQGNGLIVIAGTGSNVQGCKDGRWEKAGGWGELFADPGSGWDLARRGLEAVYAHFDATQEVTILGRSYLSATGQNTLAELVPHMLERRANKTYVASLVVGVLASAEKGDKLAKKVCEDGAAALADRVFFVTRRLGLKKPDIGLIGSVLEKNAYYRGLFERGVRKRIEAGKIFFIETPGSIGAARMVTDFPSGKPVAMPSAPAAPAVAYAASPTEARNPRSRHLDKKSVAQLVNLFVNEETHVQAALKKARPQLVALASAAAKAIKSGGRLLYVGAGTSGRLGVLDASEMPPTFNVSPGLVQGIIAGGAEALLRSQEGAEDDANGGAAAITQRGAGKGDVVVGITASGTAPFVRGALAEAKRLKAATFLLTCNPNHPKVPGAKAVILETGPEIIAGSTRLKAGTVTKLALNLVSSIAMIRSGRVKDNLMVNVQPTNAKLRDRAIRLISTLTGVDAETARKKLVKAKWDVARAAK